ncbi:MAG: T9SS C-terminal target domain-containing protein [Calditrichaeota bacterium]|nr:MAG: T9SS C-terminal target domain-containing protein [Calditrichota bacterium]
MFSKRALCMIIVVVGLATVINAQSKGQIVFVSYQVDTKIDPETNDYPDMPHIYALQDAGYEVIIFYNESLSTAEQATLDTLLNANLIVMGRSTPSPGYGDHKQAWNDIPTPIMNLELWNIRNNRLNWFNTTNMVSLGEEGVIYNAVIDVPDDPVFEGFDTSAPIPWAIGPIDVVGVPDAGNGTVLARMETDSNVLFVRFEPDVEFYDGCGDWPAGPRTVIGNGRDNGGLAPFDYYSFTEESEQIFLAEVARMVALGGGGSAVKEEENSTSPSDFVLSQNYPNPFNPQTTIEFQLPIKSSIHLQLINAVGTVVQEIVSGEFEAGRHQVTLNAENLAGGVYFYRLQAGDFADIKKCLLVK